MTRIKVVCMDCGVLVRWKDGDGVTGTSHGLCDPCAAARMAEIRLTKQKRQD